MILFIRSLIKPYYTSDSLYYVTDPDVEHIPLEELLGEVRALDIGYYNFSQFHHRITYPPGRDSLTLPAQILM